MSGPTLAVLLACRNEETWLPAQLAALAAQDVDRWVETVVVDDGSTDATAEVARAHAAALPGFRLVRGPARNRAAAIDEGLAVITAEAVVFLDGDDEVAPGYLAALQRGLIDHDVVAARLDHTTLNPPWLAGIRPHQQVEGLAAEPQRPWPVAGGGTLAVRRSALDAVGGMDPAMTYAQDTDLCWQLAAHGAVVHFVPEAVLRYRYRPGLGRIWGQARRYGRGGVVLDHRYGTPPGPARVARRVARLALQTLRLPTLVTRAGRARTTFRVAHLVGWLEAALAPRRFFPPEALRPVDLPSPPP